MLTSVLLNTLKHHRFCIQQFLTTYPTDELPLLAEKLLPIGHSQMDLYVGLLSPVQLAQEVVQKLHQQNITTELAFKEFLLPAHFQLITLSDTSRWVLRWGHKEGQYIHIHPGRYSPHTVRVKATNLKTAIAALLLQRLEAKTLDTTRLNQIRTQYLNMSPVNEVAEVHGIRKVMDLLSTEVQAV